MDRKLTISLALFLSVIGGNVFAQEAVDSVWVDSVEVDSIALAEEFNSDYESEEDKVRMDSCIQARYVIVAKNGKYGIYDREKNDSVTAVDMDYIQYSHHFHPKEGVCFCYFYYEKGLKRGKIGINMNDNTKMDASSDNPRLVANLGSCTTIDSLITEQCCASLSKCMVDIEGIQGQIAVLDAQSEELLAWVALEKQGGNITRAPLLRRFCSSESYMPLMAADCLAQSNMSMEDSVDIGNGILVVNDSLTIRDNDCCKDGHGLMTYREAILTQSRIGMYLAMMTVPDGIHFWNYSSDQTKNTNAMEMAATFNNIYHLDSINVDASRRRNIREIAIGMFKEDSSHHGWGAKKLAGMYHVAGEGKEQTASVTVCFPIDKPRYAISMVVAGEGVLPVSSDRLSDTVNGLMEWLDIDSP